MDHKSLLKNSAALERLTLPRFRLFMDAAYELTDPPICMRSFIRDIEREDFAIRSSKIGNNREELTLQVLSENHFRIRFGFRSNDVGDGGEWEVVFNPLGTIDRIEQLSWWRR